VQEELLKAVAATGKPVVVVSENGSALELNWASEHAAALLEAWYPGEEGGTAIAETLAGDNNPAGRLPLTFYNSLDQLPPFDNYAMQGRTYRYFNGRPLYRFGDGLSYTTFVYSGLKLPASVEAGKPVTVEAEVRNTGGTSGDEVAELYLTQPRGNETPIRILAGFTRVHLTADQSTHLGFQIDPRVLAQVNAEGERIVVSGDYTVSLGGAQPGDGVQTETGHFGIVGSTTLPK
jgi:beta-glucosidase